MQCGCCSWQRSACLTNLHHHTRATIPHISHSWVSEDRTGQSAFTKGASFRMPMLQAPCICMASAWHARLLCGWDVEHSTFTAHRCAAATSFFWANHYHRSRGTQELESLVSFFTRLAWRVVWRQERPVQRQLCRTHRHPQLETRAAWRVC